MLATLALMLLSPTAERPNVVLVLVDDLGWADVSFNNPDTFYETPNLARLAERSTVFTAGYAANPVCSPTRFSVMTGRYPSRVDATDWFTGRRAERFRPATLNNRMPLQEVTLAERFQAAGYRTAFLGKWHLGPDEGFLPTDQGFEINFGGCHKGHPPRYFSPYGIPTLDDGPDGEFLTERLTREAAGLIEQYAAADEPFFLDLSLYTVHTPLQAPGPLVQKYREKAEAAGYVARRPYGERQFGPEEQVWPGREGTLPTPRRVRTVQCHPTYAAMVESMDAAVGGVLEALRTAGVADNTLIVFTSDNGGLSTAEGLPTANLPLRGGKGWTYEGGIRVPFLIHTPGQTKAGTVDTPVCTIDVLPTLVARAGVADAADGDVRLVDGVDLSPLLGGTGDVGGPDAFDRDLFWHYPHYGNQGGFPSGAIRRGDWKLIERYEDGQVHLYNLADDVGERFDLAEVNQSRTAAMRSRLHAWYAEVDAKFLRPKDGATPWTP